MLSLFTRRTQVDLLDIIEQGNIARRHRRVAPKCPKQLREDNEDVQYYGRA